jgi:large subunit ribosomal protein L9
MELILLEKVQNLGDLGDRVNVRPGYGRNFLVPQGKAVAATKANVEMFEQRRSELVAKANQVVAAAEQRKQGLDGLEVTIAAQASNEGKLYGSVAPREIANALTSAGHPVDKAEVILADVLRETGDFQVTLMLHADVEAEVTIKVVAED